MNKYLALFLRIFVSFAVLFFLLSKIDIGNILGTFSRADIRLVALAFLTMIFCWVINSKKWQIILSHLQEKMSLLNLIKLNFLSLFYSAFLPGGQITGELFKFYKIAKDNQNRSILAISVFADKLSGLMAAILIGLAGLLLSKSEIANYHAILTIFLLLTTLSSLILIFFYSRLFIFIKSYLFRWQQIKYLGKIYEFYILFEKFVGAGKFMLIVLSYGILFQLLNVFYIYLLAISLGINVGYIDLIWVTSLASLILIIPVTVMGLGLREVSLIYLLGLIGVAAADAFSLSITIFVLSLLGGLGGIIFEYIDEIYLEYVKKNN